MATTITEDIPINKNDVISRSSCLESLISFITTVVFFFFLFSGDLSRSAHVILHKFLIPKTDCNDTIIIISMSTSHGTCKTVITTPPKIFISQPISSFEDFDLYQGISDQLTLKQVFLEQKLTCA